MRARRFEGLLASLLCIASAVGMAGCDDNPYDTQRRVGGASPDPLGVMAGDVLYVGPRPQCTYTDDGTPDGRAVAIRGNLLMLLFDYDNPPPPTGSATTAQSLYSLNGSDIFNLDDCMPLHPTADDLMPIMRTGRFEWPRIALSTEPQAADGSYPVRDYQIRAFYDDDGDFNPFYGVRNLATAGDVGGGALVDAMAAVPIFRHITFHNVSSPGIRELGERIEGIAVTVGAIIDTERPMFTVDDTTQALSSQAVIPLESDSIRQEELLWELARMRISLVRDADQLDFDANGTSRPWGPALAAAGIQYDFSPRVHGMPVQPVDADSNGFGDPHPVLGSNGVGWYTPMILMQRARNAVETLAGIPDVLLIGSVRPTQIGGVSQGFVARETLSAADVLVPPVAVAVINPASPLLCRVPYIPPGNAAEIYEAQRSECQELPSGNYDVNVLAGVAGAQVVDIYPTCMTQCQAAGGSQTNCDQSCRLESSLRSDTGVRYVGGQYSSQAWSVPNELGCPDVQYHPAALNQLDPVDAQGHLLACTGNDVPDGMSRLLPSQSRRGGFAVVDPDGSVTPDPASSAEGRGIDSCVNAFHTSGPHAGGMGPVDRSTQTHVPSQCCAPIMHLCGLPLCPLRDATAADAPGYPEGVRAEAGGGHMTREMRVPNVDYRMSTDANGDPVITPLCVPFMMPVDCCFQATM